MPASDSDVFEDETQELLAAVEVEGVQRGERSLSEVGDPLLEPVLLAQLGVLVRQRVALAAEVVATGLELAGAAGELGVVDHARLIAIGQATAFAFGFV